PSLRRDRRDDRWRSRLDERAVLRLPAVARRRLPLRRGVGVRHRRRHLLDHHRDVRTTSPLEPVQGRGARVRRGTRLGVGERRAVVIGLGVLAWLVGLLWIFPFGW